MRLAGISGPVDIARLRLRVDERQPAGADVVGRGDVQAAGGERDAGRPALDDERGRVAGSDRDLVGVVDRAVEGVDAVDVERRDARVDRDAGRVLDAEGRQAAGRGAPNVPVPV